MLMKQWDTNLQEGLGPADLCDFIEKECQMEIRTSCNKITHYFSQESNKELSAPVFELVQLLYAKLDDEIQHLFLKESGIIFPAIKKLESGTTIQQKIPDAIHQTQQIIINLLLKLRQQLNNYVTHPGCDKEWKACVNEIFLLENLIHQWIYIEQSLLYPAITHKIDTVQ